jgi:predicted DNA-binding protein YlxM (UPF0122 family)
MYDYYDIRERQRVYEKLNEEKVIDIRYRYAQGDISCKQLGKQYGCSSKHIWEILRGLEYRHLPISAKLQEKIMLRLEENRYNSNRKLDIDDVKWIRKVYQTGSLKVQQLADIFGVTRSAIYHIISGRTWKNI